LEPITYSERGRLARELLASSSPFSPENAYFERPIFAQDKFHLLVQVGYSAFADVDEEDRWQKTYPLPQVFFVGRVNHGLKTVDACQAHTLNV
jgi:hypothetical protein